MSSDPYSWNPELRRHAEKLVAERDRARDIAVALEQRLAYVQRTAAKLLYVHSKIVMDTVEDRALHAKTVEVFRAALELEGDKR